MRPEEAVKDKDTNEGTGVKVKVLDWKNINKFNEIASWKLGQSFIEDHFLPEI